MADEQAICTVINEQFGEEIACKEEELQRIDDRIQLAKMMLYRLRLGILAQQYGLSGFYPTEDYSIENVGVQASWNSFESEFLNSQQEEQQKQHEEGVEEAKVKGEEMEEGEREGSVSEKREESTSDLCEGVASVTSSALSSQGPSEVGEEDSDSAAESQLVCASVGERKKSSLLNDVRKRSPSAYESNLTSSGATCSSMNLDDEGSMQETQCTEGPAETNLYSPHIPASLARFATKKRVIVGNTSQFLDPSARSSIDGSTHKWMVYVRGPSEDADITLFVKAVRFFLHPSYHPNDIIRISKSPFHLTRYGWGEFPVRVQLEFTDKGNKHVDIIHNLVLDRTHTGHQTLGAETVVDLDLITHTADSLPHAEGTGTSGSAKILNNSTMHPFRAFNKNVKQRNIAASESGSARDIAVEREPSQHIHHIFLPASSSVDQVHLDHSYAQIVVVSRRPNLPQAADTDDAMDTSDLSSSEGPPPSAEVEAATLDDLLHSLVKTVPLCGPESNGFHLVAPSIEHFKKWNTGRRRATEWMRALALKRTVQAQDASIHAPVSLTTKQVVDWCRKNGYTPLDPATSSSRGFCKYCGCQLPSRWRRGEEAATRSGNCHTRCSDIMEGHLSEERGGRAGSDEEQYSSSEDDSEQEEEEGEGKKNVQAGIGQQFSTLSEPFQLFEALTTKAKKLRVLQEQQEREQEVDVLTVPSRQKKVIEAVPRFRIPQTPELKWVQQTAAAIGISIYPAVIDRMYAHVVEHMIYMACTKFARVIMDRAVNESAKQVETDSNEERCLVPLHIYRAVESLECCDFLTNSYMGLPSLEATATSASTGSGAQTLREE